MLKFLSPNLPMPSGGYAFTDPRTGLAFDGMSVTMNEQIRAIIKHRGANRNLYPAGELQWFDRESVRQEIYVQMSRVHPEIFVETTYRPSIEQRVSAEARPARACKCGSAEASPVYCQRCGNHRLQGWKCLACGLTRGLR